MSEKREAAHRARAGARARRGGAVAAHEREWPPAVGMRCEPAPGQVQALGPREEESAEDRDVIPCLRRLGYSAAEARRAAASSEGHPEASLEERLKLALKAVLPPHRKIEYSPATAT